MQRRQFLNASALSILGLPLVSGFLALNAQAETPENFTDVDADYTSENGWESLVDQPTMKLKRKFLLLQPNGTATAPDGSEIPDVIKCQLLRFSKGFTVGRHLHPEGELTYVLAGSFFQKYESPEGMQTREYKKGESIYMPAQSIHELSISGEQGTTILSFTPRNIVTLK